MTCISDMQTSAMLFSRCAGCHSFLMVPKHIDKCSAFLVRRDLKKSFPCFFPVFLQVGKIIQVNVLSYMQLHTCEPNSDSHVRLGDNKTAWLSSIFTIFNCSLFSCNDNSQGYVLSPQLEVYPQVNVAVLQLPCNCILGVKTGDEEGTYHLFTACQMPQKSCLSINCFSEERQFLLLL